MPTVTVQTFVLVLTTILTLTGNSLICLAFYRNRTLRTITNFYVLALAATDIIGVTFVYPFSAVASGLRKWPFRFNFCQFNGFLSYLWAVVSVGIVGLTAVNRYFCVVKPRYYATLFTKKKTILSIIIVLVCGITVGLAAALGQPVVFRWHTRYLFCQMTNLEVLADRSLNFVYAGFIALPMCLIFSCYGSVYRAIRRHNSAIIPSLQETVSAHEIQASRVLLAAVITFCVCWFSSIIIIILERVVQLTLPSFWQSFCTLAVASSSLVNPIIYGVMNRAMRREFLKLLCCRKET